MYGGDQPGVAALLWAKAPYLVLAGLVLPGLLLWRSGRRSGPLLSAPPPIRRALLGHLQAAEEYSWRLDRAQGLVSRSRQRLLQGWQRRPRCLSEPLKVGRPSSSSPSPWPSSRP